MPRRRIAGLILAALAVALWTGCGEERQEPEHQRKYRVALVMKSLANEFFKTMEDGARAHQKKNADVYDLLANGIKDERDVERQVAIVDQMIAQGVDAIVIAPADSRALIPICKKALDAGIVVVNIDNKFDDDALRQRRLRIPFVGPDNRKGARTAARYLARFLKPGDKVAIVEGIPNAINGVMRKLGFEAAMNSAEIKVAASQSAYWEMDKAERVVAGMLTQHPDLKAILCANDSMALGALAALKAAGKLGKVYVVGYDNISAIQKHILAGNVLCTVDQHADQIAVEGIRYALDILHDRVAAKAPDKETRVDLITAETLKAQTRSVKTPARPGST